MPSFSALHGFLIRSSASCAATVSLKRLVQVNPAVVGSTLASQSSTLVGGSSSLSVANYSAGLLAGGAMGGSGASAATGTFWAFFATATAACATTALSGYSAPKAGCEQVPLSLAPPRTDEKDNDENDSNRKASQKTRFPPLHRRMTPIGRFSVLSETPVNPSIVTCLMVLRGHGRNASASPLTKDDLLQLWRDRGMMDRHSRFRQTASPTRPGYFLDDRYSVNLDRHFIESLFPVDNLRKELQRRISWLQTTQWDLSDSLWHMYVMPSLGTQYQYEKSLESELGHPGKTARSARGEPTIVLFQGHHALGDGASLGAAFMDFFDEADIMRQRLMDVLKQRRKHRTRGSSWLRRLVRKFLILAWIFFGSLQALAYQIYVSLLASFDRANPWSILKQDASSSSLDRSYEARTISWVNEVAPIDQVKWVARELAGPKATINDVFVSCVTAAIARQLEYHRYRRRRMSMDAEDEDLSALASNYASELPQQRAFHISIPVHLKGGVVLPGESVSNQIGAFVARLPGEMESTGDASERAQERLLAVHKELYAIKQTPVPLISHFVAKTLSNVAGTFLPQSWTPWMYERASAGSVAVVTNTRGPTEPLHLKGRSVESFLGFVPLPPGLPMGIVLGSYAGHITMTLSACPWAVPDGDQFLSWVLEEYLELVKAAKLKQN